MVVATFEIENSAVPMSDKVIYLPTLDSIFDILQVIVIKDVFDINGFGQLT